MVERFQALSQQIFEKQSLEECDLSEIQALVDRYPYFAAAQFLLLEKLRQLNSPEYPSQLQKSILYYSDPVSFELFLNDASWQTPEDWHQFHEPPIELVVETSRTENTHSPPAHDIPAAPPAPLSEFLKKTEEEPQELSFEPFHTVDYFASQGIKLSAEEIPKDRFGKQVRSFTEWLKTMKRFPGQESPATLEASVQKKVEHLAESSIESPEVLTESMAEVWIKQGNTQKAIEVYEKLSLINSAKRTYFAALIENLKRS